MVRQVIRLHTGILAVASLALLVTPAPILAAFGITDPALPVLALTRVLAGLVALVAAAVLPVADLAPAPQRRALGGLAAAYLGLAALLGIQQVAIWTSVAGVLLTGECLVHAAAFAWLARDAAVMRLGRSAGV